MKYEDLKRWVMAVFASIGMIMLATSAVQAGSLLDEMQVPDTCGASYADKLASCTPFRCSKPGPMTMMSGFPAEDELNKMPLARQQKMRESKAAAEKKIAAMSPQARAAMKARMTSVLEIKGYDAQGRCRTSTLAIPGQRLDCTLGKTLLQHFADYTRVAASAKHIQMESTSRLVNGKMVTEQVDVIDGKPMSNPWKEAFDNGQCKMANISNPASVASAAPPQTKNTGQSVNTLFILDASGSMWGQINGKPKIAIAKEVMAKLVPELPDNSRIGLIAYGHRRKGDCNDVETLVKPGQNNKQAVLNAVQGLNAKGKTPLTRSVNQAFKMLQSTKQPATIILVSDGIESCGSDPCETVKAAKKYGLKFILHTVGFGLSEKESAQLQCMAKAGGGEYFQANNAEELLKSARKAVQPTGTLKLTVKVNGTVTNLGYRIEDADTGNVIRDPVLATPSGMAIRLADGRYNVFVSPAGVSGASEKKLPVTIKSGEVVEKTLNFDKGTLNLTVTVNGKPVHAGIHVEDPVTHKWIYQASVFGVDTPVSISLAAGKVDIVVQAGGRDMPEQRVEGIEIVAGKTTEQVIPVEVKVDAPIAAETSGMEKNTDRPGGNDFRHFSPAKDDPALCQKACREAAQCQAWTYVKPNTVQGPQPNCWLKQTAPPAVSNNCCVSGLKGS